jgi:hypothetical protein
LPPLPPTPERPGFGVGFGFGDGLAAFGAGVCAGELELGRLETAGGVDAG